MSQVRGDCIAPYKTIEVTGDMTKQQETSQDVKRPVDRLVIPEMTDPLGAYWEQPDGNNIEIDEESALITDADLKKLHEYSTSIPSGVYVGKMWKRDCGNGEWKLCWYGHDEPGMCSINSRIILKV